MAWGAGLREAEELPEVLADMPCIEDMQGPVPGWQRLMKEPGVIAVTNQIVCAYGGMLEMVCKGYHRQRHRLFPESIPPCLKETIRAALALSFLQLECQGRPRRGISPAELLAGAQALDMHFAPDQEVPAHPIDNRLAFMRRLRTLSTVPTSRAAPWITARPMGWEGLLVIAGVPKDRRDTLINELREATWPLSAVRQEESL